MSPAPMPAEASNSCPAHRALNGKWFWGSLAALALAIIVMSPLVQDPIQYPEGWLHILSETFRTGVRFGSDVIFTFGPWGFVYGGYHPKTFVLTCCAWVVFSLLIGCVGRRAFDPRRTRWSSGKSTILLLGWTLLLGGVPGGLSDSRLFLLSFILILNHFYLARQRVDWLTLAICAALGFSGDVKLTLLATGGFAVAAVTLSRLPERRIFVWPIVTFVGTFLIAWVAAGQTLRDLPTFFRTSLQVIAGFDAMATHARFYVYEIAAYLLIAASSLLLIGCPPRRPQKWLIGSTFAGLIFFVFRASYIRHDVHSFIGCGVLSMFVPLLAVTRWPDWSAWPRKAALVSIAGCLLFSEEQGWRYTYGTARFLALQAGYDVIAFGTQISYLARGLPTTPARAYIERMAEMRSDAPLPAMTGTTDVIPLESDIASAYHFHLTPRPTLHSYAAYTPALARANANFYAGPRRPDNVIFRVGAIDDRLPSVEDNLLWLELIKRYKVAGVFGHWLQLVPSQQPRTMEAVEFDHVRVELNQPFAIPNTPNGGLLWAQIQISATPIGKLMGQLYRPPEVFLAVSLVGGRTAKHRLILANAAEGFLLGPYVESNTTFIEMLADPRVTYPLLPYMPRQASVITAPGAIPLLYLKQTIEIYFHELHFSPAPVLPG